MILYICKYVCMYSCVHMQFPCHMMCQLLHRSPGGTPMRRKDQVNMEPASNDPAAVIAQALRRKFANRMFQDSPGTYVHYSDND